MFDLIILGGGPGGCAAAVYAARKRLKTLLITESFGGQSIVSETIYNWIGTPEIGGNDLAKALESHVRAYEEPAGTLTVHTGERVASVEQGENGAWVVKTAQETFSTKTILVTTGSSRKKLTIPGADTFENRGVVYCASCDGPIFSGQDVVVVGGGNAGFESAAQLLAYCKSVTLVHHSASFRADPITVEKVLAHPNMKSLLEHEPVAVVGEKFVTGFAVKNKKTGEEVTLPAGGIFIEIGQIPNTDFVKDVVELTPTKNIITDPRTQTTSAKGIWAAGDVTDTLYHQNNIAAGDAVRAVEDLYLWIKTQA